VPHCPPRLYLRRRFTEDLSETKLVITAVRNTHFIVYWYFEVNKDFYKRNAIVLVVIIALFMYDYSCSTMNISTRIVESGAIPHRDRSDTSPSDSEILMFVLRVHLQACCIINSIESLAMNILCVYIQSERYWEMLWDSVEKHCNAGMPQITIKYSACALHAV